MEFILIAGLWLDGRAWDEVAPELESRGHGARPLTLPGQGDGAQSATLAEQTAAVVAAVDDALSAGAGRVVVVGHSAAATLAWLAADARPDAVSVVMIGGWPALDGEPYADLFEPVDGLMRFPGWAPFEGPDAADLDPAARSLIEAGAIPVPVGVSRGEVRYHDERRYQVRVLLVCPEFTPDEAREWMANGDLGDLTNVKDVRLADIDSGHWPMYTRPGELAEILAGFAG